jgi:serine/threonine-protein kinase
VIKEGRRHGETDSLGRDGFFQIKREAQFLRSTGIAALPRVMRTFRANGCYYLVMERLFGRSLQQALASRERMSTRRILEYCGEMAGIVADIHAAGWAWGDCKPANFLLQKGRKLRALDFEGACRLHKADPLWWRTPGYSPPKWQRKPGDLEAADLYALGTSIMQVIGRRKSPMNPVATFKRETRKRNLPAHFAKMIRSLRNPKAETRPSARTTQRVLEELLRNSS